MITEAEIVSIMRSYYTYEEAAGEILSLIKLRESELPAPAPANLPDLLYVKPGCDCGGERCKTAHADWCLLNNPQRGRR